MKFKSEFLNEINERGFIYQHTEIEDLDYIVSKNNTILNNISTSISTKKTYT